MGNDLAVLMNRILNDGHLAVMTEKSPSLTFQIPTPFKAQSTLHCLHDATKMLQIPRVIASHLLAESQGLEPTIECYSVRRLLFFITSLPSKGLKVEGLRHKLSSGELLVIVKYEF